MKTRCQYAIDVELDSLIKNMQFLDNGQVHLRFIRTAEVIADPHTKTLFALKKLKTFLI